MSTSTTNFNMEKPGYQDVADVQVLNQNTETIDTIMYQNRSLVAEVFKTTESYSSGKIVVYNTDGKLYRFKVNHSAGAWNSSQVDEVKLLDLIKESDNVVEGYYYNNKFYKESAHTTEITGESDRVYVDLSTDNIYRYNGTVYSRLNDPTDIIDDTAGDGDTSKTWSADKITDELSEKADKVSNATNGNLAGLDTNGNLTDSGISLDDTAGNGDDNKLWSADKTYGELATKADKVDSATQGDLAGLDANGNLTDSGISLDDTAGNGDTDKLWSADKTYDELATKTDKVSNATSGDLAGLDSNGNLTDSGIALDDNAGNGDTNKLWSADKTTDELALKAPIDSPTFTGIPKSVTPVSNSDAKMIATKEYVDGILATQDAMVYKGTIAGTATSPGAFTPAADRGHTYKVSSPGYVNGIKVEIGDMFICQTDNTNAATSSNYETVQQNWNVIQANVEGAVIGPASSTANHVATFDSNTGKLIKDSGFTIEKSVPPDAVFTDTTYESKQASSGGTDVSLVTTGEKYTWNNKVDKNQGSGNSGKILGINSSGEVTPIPFDGQDFTGATSSTDGTHGYVPKPVAGDQGKFLKGNGTWSEVDQNDFTGATSSAAGTHGFVPAPSAGDNGKFLKGNGTWASALVPGDIDDTAGSGDTNKLWSADKVASELDDKADKVSNATSGDLASFDSNGNLSDSGIALDDTAGDGDTNKIWSANKTADELASKTDKVQNATSGDLAGLDSNGNITDSGIKLDDAAGDGDTDKIWSADKVTDELSDKVDKVTNATNGNFAGLDANGNLVDSGKKASDFKTKQTEVSNPTASGTATAFISGITQNENGVITPTKANAPTASTSVAGLVQLNDTLTSSSTSQALTAAQGKVLNDKIVKGLDEKAEVICKTIDTPASIISFNDGADNLPVRELKVAIEPVQDLHGYDHPWLAGTVPNLISDGTDTSNGYEVNKYLTSDGGEVSSDNFYISEYFAVEPGTVYTLSKTPSMSSNAPSICFYDSGKTYISGVAVNQKNEQQITTPANAAYARCSQKKNMANGFYQFELGDTATELMPYSNICPISGWTGAKVMRTRKNFFPLILSEIKKINTAGTWNGNAYTLRGITFVVNDDGTIYVSGTNTVDKATGLDVIIESLPVGTYTFSGLSSEYKAQEDSANYNSYMGISVNGARSQYVRKGNNENGYYFTVDEGTVASKAWIAVNPNKTVNGYTFYPMIAEGTDVDFEPYQGATYDITFPTEAGTVYGGTLTLNQDGTGELVVDRAKVGLGSLTWEYKSNNLFYTKNIANMKLSALRTQYLICSCYKTNVGGGAYDDKTIYNGALQDLYIVDTNYSDVTSFAASVIGQTVVYPLATPIIHSLTASQVRILLGLNNIWADTGDINLLTYPVDGDVTYAIAKHAEDIKSIQNKIGNTILPTTAQTLTDAIAEHEQEKLAKNQGASNAGLFMKIDTDGELIPSPVSDPTGKADKVTNATSGNFAGLDTNGNLTDSGSKASDFLQQSQGVANAGKIVKVNDSGYLELATAETSKLVVFNLDTVTNTSGPYSHTTQIAAASHDMQAIVIDVADPGVFKSAISVTPIDGGITLECASVEGTSAVSVSCMFIANANKFTSDEFDVLANRITDTADDLLQKIGDTNLPTTAQTLTGAIAEHEQDIASLNDNIEKVQNGLAYIVGDTNTTGSTLAAGQFVYVKGHATIPEGLRKVTASISANGSITTNNTEACPEGGLNALNSKIVQRDISSYLTVQSGISVTHKQMFIAGNVVSIYMLVSGTISNGALIATISPEYTPITNRTLAHIASYDTGYQSDGVVWIRGNGQMIYNGSANAPLQSVVFANFIKNE